jgi:hypothetical protein
MECVEGGLNGDVFEGCLLRVPDHGNVLVLSTLSTQEDGYFEKASKLKGTTSLVQPTERWKTFCTTCSHPAFTDSSSQLCIVQLRNPNALTDAVVPVLICGQPQLKGPNT